MEPKEMSGFTEEEYTFAKHVGRWGKQVGKQAGKDIKRMEAKSIPFNCRTRPWSISKRVLRLSPRLYRADKEKNEIVLHGLREQREK